MKKLLKIQNTGSERILKFKKIGNVLKKSQKIEKVSKY